jgi:phage shock protein C
MSTTQTPPPTYKRLTRNPDDKMIGGVCAGVADYFGIDVTLVRVLTVLGAVFGLGSLLVAYVVAWILVPQR